MKTKDFILIYVPFYSVFHVWKCISNKDFGASTHPAHFFLSSAWFGVYTLFSIILIFELCATTS